MLLSDKNYSLTESVESQKSYAIVLMPHGGSPDYNVWTATVGGKDTITGNPVYAPPGTGDLFLSSNDMLLLRFIPFIF